MTPTIDHISVSMMQSFNSCPWCFVKKYFYKLKQPYYQPFADGSRIHKEVDNYHKGLDYDKDLITPYTNKYPKYYRIKSEVKFRASLKVGSWQSPVPIVGIFDGVTTQGLCDLKFAKAKPKTDKNIQSILYSAIYYQTKNIIPLFEFNWFNKTNNKVKTIATQHNKDDFLFIKEIILEFINELSFPISVLKHKPPKNPWFGVHFDDCPNIV